MTNNIKRIKKINWRSDTLKPCASTIFDEAKHVIRDFSERKINQIETNVFIRFFLG